MPLVFVHGVANRPGDEQEAEIAQRNGLFRAITFRNQDTKIFNPDWGSHAVTFSGGMPWLPNPNELQPFAAGNANISDAPVQEIGLGRIAKVDGAQAVDLTVLAALERSIVAAGESAQPAAAADKDLLSFARAAADYLTPYLSSATAPSKGIAALEAKNDQEFADALDTELALSAQSENQAFGITDRLQDAINALGGWIGNTASDAVLRAKRRKLSQGAALFLGDIFVYLRNRDNTGSSGTAARLFAPIITDVVKAAQAPRGEKEPLVIVGHSLGGVLLYDILTDPACLADLHAKLPDLHIDCLLTVGSQPGFFADLGMYIGRSKNPSGLYPRPACVSNWLNVYDFTDVFSFLCKPFFEGVDDFGYDTAIDLLHAHSAYFKRPSFYKRLELRLKGLGYL